jgi:hypothetical protein
MLIRRKKSSALGEAFLGKDAYEYVRVPDKKEAVPQERNIVPRQERNMVPKKQATYKGNLPDGFAPPQPGYKKPFNYKLWNTLRKLKRV